MAYYNTSGHTNPGFNGLTCDGTGYNGICYNGTGYNGTGYNETGYNLICLINTIGALAGINDSTFSGALPGVTNQLMSAPNYDGTKTYRIWH